MPVPIGVNWAVRLTAVIAIVSVVKDRFGTPACFAAMVGMFVSGFLPPVFPLLYRAYTTRTVGFRIRHVLHPRLPSHSTTIFGARRLVESGDGVASPGVFIVPVAVLADNYSYVIGCERTHTCAVVDPADPKRVLEAVQSLGYEIKLVLTTHKHWDHAGGNDELRAMLPDGVKFVGSEEDRPAACNMLVNDGAVLRFGDVEVQALLSPGHTTGHLMYKVRHAPSHDGNAASSGFLNADPTREANTGFAPLTHSLLAAMEPLYAFRTEAFANAKDPRVAGLSDRLNEPIKTVSNTFALFTGDCIFCGGCGAMFECRAATDVLLTYDLLHRLHAACPRALCFVGHEYTQRLFGELVQRYPKNVDLKRRYSDVCQWRKRDECTVPSTLADEAATNPLMTLDREELVRMATAGVAASDVETAVYLSTHRRTPAGKAITPQGS